MKMSLTLASLEEIHATLIEANRTFTQTYSSTGARRQPIHTVYGGAQLFRANTAEKIGRLALQSLQHEKTDFVVFAKALGLRGAETLKDAGALKKIPADHDVTHPLGFAHWVYSRVHKKLETAAVEDFRIDFEDGYGNRPDSEEDHHAEAAALELAEGFAAQSLPPFIGIRIKPFSEEYYLRSARTLDIFLTTLLEKTNKFLPENFVITLPKITCPTQISTLAMLLGVLEARIGLRPGILKMEAMVETPQLLVNHRGLSALPLLLVASDSRLVSAHFGAYDYMSACNITAPDQRLTHPACELARQMMQVSFAGTGVSLSDGATNILPIGDQEQVHRAWRLSYENIRNALKSGFYQGWDLHPSQLPARYAAVYSFFIENLESTATRLRNFVEKAAQATLIGGVFDDAATGQGLLGFFLRGLSCGALTPQDLQNTGLTLEEIQTRSFLKIVDGRRKAS